jgi:hypothetical protein
VEGYEDADKVWGEGVGGERGDGEGGEESGKSLNGLKVFQMKNTQVIDGAENSTYSIFAATDEGFEAIFPAGGEEKAAEITSELSKRSVAKKMCADYMGRFSITLLRKSGITRRRRNPR